MVPIPDEDAGVELGALAARVRASSNFRFAWRWFGLVAPGTAADGAARVTKRLIEDPACHEFLRESFEPLYDPTFQIGAVHPHARFVEATSDFHQTLAQAAGDRLGAYSRDLTDADPKDVARVREAFAAVEPYSVFALEPGRQDGCATCKGHNSHLFTNWFYGVAWDWYFVLLPHRRPLAWIGLLTDTD